VAGDLCLAIDLGTGGLKVGLVDLDGTLVAHELHGVSTTFGEHGRAHQDAGEWWDLICGAARRLVAATPGAGERVAAVAVTGQWASTVPVDASGRPTAPCITWQDYSSGRLVRERIGGRVAGYRARHVLRWVRRTAGAPSLSGADPIGHVLGFQADEPEAAAATRWYLEPVDYLTMQFCGEATATPASMQAAWLTDVRHLDRLRYDPQLLDAVGLPADRLPPLRAIGSIVGTVTAPVATALGITPRTVVLTGLPDLQAAALGAGATSMYATHLALSTTSWISCPVPKKKTDISHSIAVVPGLTPDAYLVVDNQDTGAKALEWFRGALGGTASYDELTALAATVPPGARGVLFTPWLAGERSPVANRRARGGFTNVSLTSGTAELARAVLEGVAANSRWLLGHVEKFCGRPLGPIRMVGGGAQSAVWCQIYADALDRTVEQVPEPMYAQLRGMAALAAVALGDRTLGDVDAARPKGTMFEPDPSGVASMATVSGQPGPVPPPQPVAHAGSLPTVGRSWQSARIWTAGAT
jgi:xylulokinase